MIALNSGETRHLLVPTYTTANAALAAAPAGALLIVSPGSYPVMTNLDIDRKLTVIGRGGMPVFTQLANTFNLLAGADLTLDGVRLNADAGSYVGAISVPGRPVKLLANRTWIERSGDFRGCLLGASNPDTPGGLRFQHCSLTAPAWGGATLWGSNLNNIALHRCYTPHYNETFCSQSLFEDDKTQTPLPGYGHEYGTPIVEIEPYFVEISSRVLDLRANASPRVVLFDWLHPEIFAEPSAIDSAGHWSGALVPSGATFGLYYLSRDSRCPPIIHGPYTAE